MLAAWRQLTITAIVCKLKHRWLRIFSPGEPQRHAGCCQDKPDVWQEEDCFTLAVLASLALLGFAMTARKTAHNLGSVWCDEKTTRNDYPLTKKKRHFELQNDGKREPAAGRYARKRRSGTKKDVFCKILRIVWGIHESRKRAKRRDPAQRIREKDRGKGNWTADHDASIQRMGEKRYPPRMD